MYRIINWLTQKVPFPRRGWKYARKLIHFLNIQNRTYKKKLSNGLYVYVSPVDWVQENLFWYGHYERNELIAWSSFVKTDSQVIDIGANIGLYSLVAAAKAPQGRIVAFEPLDEIRARLVENIQLNGFPNVEVYPYAASNADEETKLFIGKKNNLSMSSLQPNDESSGKTQIVKTVSLDRMFPALSADLVKIDVEGAEMKVLTGMKDMVERSRPVIFIEAIDKQLTTFGNTVTELYKFFSDRGYNAYLVSGPNELTTAEEGMESYTIVFFPKEKGLPSQISIN